MTPRTSPTLSDLFHAAPAKTSLLAVAPVTLALGQLVNSFVTDFPLAPALGFAACMVAFAVVATDHHAAEVHLERLERSVDRSRERTRPSRPQGRP